MKTFVKDGVDIQYSEEFFSEEAIGYYFQSPTERLSKRGVRSVTTQIQPPVGDVKTIFRNEWNEMISKNPVLMNEAMQKYNYTFETGLSAFLLNLDTPTTMEMKRTLSNKLTTSYEVKEEEGAIVHSMDKTEILRIPRSLTSAFQISDDIEIVLQAAAVVMDAISVIAAILGLRVAIKKKNLTMDLTKEQVLDLFGDLANTSLFMNAPQAEKSLKIFKFVYSFLKAGYSLDQLWGDIFGDMPPFQKALAIIQIVATIGFAITTGGTSILAKAIELGAAMAILVTDVLRLIELLNGTPIYGNPSSDSCFKLLTAVVGNELHLSVYEVHQPSGPNDLAPDKMTSYKLVGNRWWKCPDLSTTTLGKEAYYSTVRTVGFNNKLYVVSRKANTRNKKIYYGGVTALFLDKGWGWMGQSSPLPMEDSSWDFKYYYSTMQTAVVKNELYLLVRGHAGMSTWKFGKNKEGFITGDWIKITKDGFPTWGNETNKWNDTPWLEESHYSTIQTAVVNNELYLLGRGVKGIVMYRLVENAGGWGWTPVNFNATIFPNPKWSTREYYSTIQTAIVNNELYLLGRSQNEMTIAKLSWLEKPLPPHWQWISQPNVVVFSDPNSWKKEEYYSTIQTAVVDNQLYLIARESGGIVTWRLAGKVWESVDVGKRPMTESGWNDKKYYSTIQTVVVNNELYVLGRGPNGVEIHKLLTRGSTLFQNVWQDCSNINEKNQ